MSGKGARWKLAKEGAVERAEMRGVGLECHSSMVLSTYREE